MSHVVLVSLLGTMLAMPTILTHGTPEQIERIEILRAPTAETGARAIAAALRL